MEDELRLSLLVAGTCFIIAVLAHGIWKIRKHDKPQNKPRVEPRQWGDEIDDSDENSSLDEFDELGLGKVRVIKTNVEGDAPLSSNPDVVQDSVQSTDQLDSEPLNDETESYPPDDSIKSATQQSATHSSGTHSSATQASGEQDNNAENQTTVNHDAQKSKLYGSVVSNPKPHLQSQYESTDDSPEFPEPPDFLLKDDESDASTSDSTPVADEAADMKTQTAPTQVKPVYKVPEEEVDLASPASTETAQVDASVQPDRVKPTRIETQTKPAVKAKRSKPISRKRQEPNFGNDQMRIDFDENQGVDNDTSAALADSGDHSAKDSGEHVEEVLVLNVRTSEDAPISGAALLPMLLTLGFKFGDQNIFHRHVNANGKGPVLFSLANMFKPGVFDIDSLETFTTQGVSLFMILPIEGDPHQVFNMMHNAARKLADEFNAQVLDGRRSVLTKQGLQQYVEKIREFERRRMISRQ